MKKSKFNLIPIISIFMLILFAVCSMSFFENKTNNSFAQSAQSNSTFYLDLYDRNGNLFSTDTEGVFNGEKKRE